MQAVDEPLDDRPSEQLEIPDPRQNRGIEKGRRRERGGCHAYIPDFGSGTALISFSMI